MDATTYPLGHDKEELARLDTQAKLLHDPLLSKLASTASSCLEVGCGSGANLPFLRNANPNLNYTGVDIAPKAIAAAKNRFHADALAKFAQMDALSLLQGPQQFDLIFTTLVLWAVGPDWPLFLSRAYELLAPGGAFYALEPSNQLIQVMPEKPKAKAWMQAWDQANIQNGLDPFIGPKVAGALIKAGFTSVNAKFHPLIALGTDKEKYQAVLANLKGFYMGQAAENLSLDKNLKEEACAELEHITDDSMVMDALFVSWGYKPKA